MNFSSYCALALLSLSGLIGNAAAAEKVLVSHDFSPRDQAGAAAWTAWATNEQPVTIGRIKTDGGYALQLNTAVPEYNTPIVNLVPPLKITRNTFLEFELKIQASEEVDCYEINLFCPEENYEYCTIFPSRSGDWFKVRINLADASPKRQLGKAKLPQGLLSQHLGRVQIAVKGKEVRLRNFKIYETTAKLTSLPLPPDKLIPQYTPVDYACLRRGGVFPFGVIATVASADTGNGLLFKQNSMERFEADLLDLKRHYLNTFCNFCDPSQNLAERLKLMHDYRLYLIDTLLANSDLSALPENHRYFSMLKQFDGDERLLAWYGKDEPMHCSKYLNNKLLMNRYSPSKPSVSAFGSMLFTKILGPYMEIMMPETYQFRPDIKDAVAALIENADRMRESRRLSGGNRIWYIAQSFGQRLTAFGATSVGYRYPTPAEINFETFNAVTAGADGLIFFIYNDFVPYLDNQRRLEEFDRTLVDAWGNGNPTYEALSVAARRLVPVMPSLLGAEEIEPYRFVAERKIVTEMRKNQFGRYWFFANTDLNTANRFSLPIKLADGEKVYDLTTLREVAVSDDCINLELPPGDGTVLMLAAPDKFNAIAAEITARRQQTEAELAAIDIMLFRRAKFKVDAPEKTLAAVETLLKGKSDAADQLTLLRKQLQQLQNANPEYCAMRRDLDAAQAQFGLINHLLTQPENINRIDPAPNQEWKDFFTGLKESSRRYFALRRAWASGNYSQRIETEKMRKEVEDMWKALPDRLHRLSQGEKR